MGDTHLHVFCCFLFIASFPQERQPKRDKLIAQPGVFPWSPKNRSVQKTKHKENARNPKASTLRLHEGGCTGRIRLSIPVDVEGASIHRSVARGLSGSATSEAPTPAHEVVKNGAEKSRAAGPPFKGRVRRVDTRSGFLPEKEVWEGRSGNLRDKCMLPTKKQTHHRTFLFYSS